MRWLAIVLFLSLFPTIAQAQSAAPPQAKINDLVRLLQDPEMKAWLESQKPSTAAASPAAKADTDLQDWDQQTRASVNQIVSAIPKIPSEVAAASERTRADAISHGYAPVMIIFAIMVAIGIIIERLFLRLYASKSRKLTNSTASRLSEFIPIGVFTIVVGLIFFAFDWPPLARTALLAYLLAFIAYRCISVITGFIVDSGPLRRRVLLFIGVLAFAIATAKLGAPLGVDPAVTKAISYCFSAILFLIAMEAIWRASKQSRTAKGILSLWLLGIWVLWCLSLKGLVWIGIYILILPPILRAVGKSVEEALTPPDGSPGDDIKTVLFVRGSRACVIALAVGWLAVVWHLNPESLAHQDPTLSAIVHGLLKGIIILLIADLVWQMAKAFIDRRLKTFSADPSVEGKEAASQHRIATLLPIFKNALAVLVLVATALTVLAELGVQIGPLIAGAGIFGVAIGFGSQTLVKDVISGIFYMLDDAFRVGEYIQSGSYKGTVESFSLRSVRLRHHRGPIFTVPFGSLGAVQNMSRDWVIDKFMLRVPFDTDIAQVKRLVKGVGAEMMADPELAPFIIQTVKMKGVEQIGDFGIELSFAFTAHPGHQSAVRRRAYTMIRDAFRTNGIDFAQPTVQVGGEEKAASAAAASASRNMAVQKAALAAGGGEGQS
jgi:small-conductance mechanosensitive channel